MTDTLVTTRSGGLEQSIAGHPVNLAGMAWFFLAIFSTLPLFWFGLYGLSEDWARPEFSHGPVIPLLSFYMFLHEMKQVPPPAAPVTDRWPGVLVIGVSLLLALAGNLVGIYDFVFYSLIIWVGGLILTGFGWRRGIVFWPSVLHLIFMLPLPQVLYWKISSALQFVSSEIGVGLLQIASIPVFLEGNIIDLGVYKLQVAEACSGLRYLFPIMSFTYVFAVLYSGPRWHKMVLLTSAVPLAVLMNSIRIGIIGILVDRYGIAQAEGFLHAFEGWVIFLTCIGILFLMAMAMQRLSGDRRPLGEALDMDFSGLGAQFGRVRTIPPSRGLVTAALMTLALSAAWSFAPAREASTPEREPFALFPLTIGGWSGNSSLLAPDVESTLGADDYFSGTYRNIAEAEDVDFFMSYYVDQTSGNAIHDPEVCLPGSGWEVYSIAPTEISLPGTQDGRVRINRVVIQKELDQQLVYYWFAGRGRQVTNDFAAKLYTVYDSAVRGRTDGGLVRVITPIGEGGEAAADARLQRFLVATRDKVRDFIPE
ncbi:VPLPA-CTERM-specific exosortase XrtD [Amaricoccus sp. B4]|uniref:VPLPA-CTERM-specific exosortase XrtD n=1 Tax=Amaricoccus sp. B4 TaxID=3368557 RepID=UPI00371A67FE